MRIYYNSPYSPFLNPIEEIFGVIKNRLRVMGPFESCLELARATVGVVNKIKSTTFLRTTNRAFKAMIKALHNELQ